MMFGNKITSLCNWQDC